MAWLALAWLGLSRSSLNLTPYKSGSTCSASHKHRTNNAALTSEYEKKNSAVFFYYYMPLYVFFFASIFHLRKTFIFLLTASTAAATFAVVVLLAHKQIPLMAYCGDFNGHSMHKKEKNVQVVVFALSMKIVQNVENVTTGILVLFRNVI
uniref:Uncharacterized protein n=1 Tax=Glossina brevipalpis TaxID=37001 RepID=A0A1A9WLC1_9MUSC